MDNNKKYISIFFLINIFSIVSSASYTNISEFSGSQSWIRLCKSPSGAENIIGAERAEKCSAGFWFKDTVKVGCVCGHGVWIFAKGWCDRTAKVIVAYNGSCFSVDKDVRYIRNIGYSNNAFVPYHFQTTVGFEYVQELPSGFGNTYFSQIYDQHLGSIFPAREIESQNSKRCLEHHLPGKRAVALKYYADKLPYKQVDECFKVMGMENLYTYDDQFDLNEFFVMREKSKDPSKPYGPHTDWIGNDTRCSSECVGNGKIRTTPAPATATSFPPDYYDPLNEEMIPNNSTNKTKVCDESIKKYSLTNKTIREITEQTKRMILANLGNSLKGIATPKVEVKDYLYFQMARKVLLSVCPNEEVPHSLVTGLLRMFRVAVKESLLFYPFTEKGDEHQASRITSSLKACLNNSRPFEFNYGNTTLKNATCAMELQNVTYNYKTSGTTNITRALRTDIPCELETDLSQLDLPVETAWKTVMFTHYYCARHFMLNTTDYSGYYDKMEMFFNRWIQHRWYYPGPSLKAYEYVFQNYDLKKFAKGLDRCIAASRSFSNYRKWIQRPIYIKHCGGSVFQELDDKKSSGSGTKPKLDAITPELTEFGKKAYCLPYWHTPASNPGINYDSSKDTKGEGCVEYKKQEWQDDMTPNTDFNWNNVI